jgi:hypothetical protein
MENENTTTSANLYPEVGSAFSYGWEILKKNFVPLLLVIIVISVLSAFGPAVVGHNYYGFGFFVSLFGIFFLGPVNYGKNWVFLKASRNEAFELKDIFNVFGPHYWEIVLASLLVSVIIGFGIVLLIVPGIIFACRLAFVPYLVVDKNFKAVDAISKSWEMTKGFAGKIFVMGIVSFFIAIAGFICLFVGIFPAQIWISSAFASFYHAVDIKSFRVIEV